MTIVYTYNQSNHIWAAVKYWEKAPFQFLTRAQIRSTQRERERLFGGHMPAFRPFQFKYHIPEPSA
jgi:hypothetical protein